MSRTPSPAIKQRNAAIVKKWVDEGVGVKALSDEFGPSPQGIRAILRDAGVRSTRKRGSPSGAEHPAAIYDKPVISQLHVKAGMKFNYYVWRITKESITDVAVKLGLSERLLSLFRLGLGDPTLSQLMRIANYMGVELRELIDPTYDIKPSLAKRSDDH